MSFKQYQSHKKVLATKIVSFTEVECPSSEEKIYHLKDEHGELIQQPSLLFARGLPQDDYFYLVQYEDGYISWSPKKVFEEGYTEITATTPKVEGYSVVSDDKIDNVNVNKRLEEVCLRRVDVLREKTLSDSHCLNKAEDLIKTAFMWFNRGIFQPQRIKLEGDK